MPDVATVLIVDDEPDILEILQLTLEHAGYRVLTATDGAEALDAVAREVPDAMLLDVGMPHLNGWQVLERLKSAATPDLATVPVVMVTAWNAEEDQLRGSIEGAVRYVGKPFDPNEIVAIIGDLLAPGAPTEPELRRRAQQSALERLARIERGPGAPDTREVPRVHLTKLDRPRPGSPPAESGTVSADALEGLSPKQREVVRKVAQGLPISAIATELDVSRSNVYAILRRVARKLDARGGRDLIHRLRRSELGSDAGA